MPYRLLHSADLHLDRAFGSLPDWAARQRRAALRRRLEALLTLAAKIGADALTIGGDLFDADTAAADLDGFLRATFAATALPVYIAPGNHDPAGPGSLYRRVEWPANVRVFFDEGWATAPLAPGLELWGTAFLGPERRDNPFASAPAGPALRLALLHADAAGRPGEGRYAPFAAADSAAAGFALALLGHIHQATAERPGPHPAWLYPGSPEPLDFGEAGERGVALVEVAVAARRVRVERLPLATLRYHTAALTLDGQVGARELRAAATAAAAEHPEWRGHYLRLLLQGQATLAEGAAEIGELAAATGAALVLPEDHTAAPWDLEALAREGTVRGAFVRRLLQRQAAAPEEERALWGQALAHGLDALAGRRLAAP